MTSPARLREHEMLAAALSALGADRNATGSTFCLGAMAALRWLTEGGASPLTGASIGKPVALRATVGELSAAEAVIYGRPSDQRRYAAGVEHAQMWAQFATSTPPAPADLGSRAALQGQLRRPAEDEGVTQTQGDGWRGGRR